MIEEFKELEMRNSGIIYNSTFAQIKQMYEVDPERAGELAISAIELVLTGELSSDDVMIAMLLEPMKKINENNQVKYDTKLEGAKAKKIAEMKLDKIAELVSQGRKQREIGELLGMSQQIVSYRVGLIKSSYPELLNGPVLQKKDQILQTKVDVYKSDKNEILLKQEEVKEEAEPVKRTCFDF